MTFIEAVALIVALLGQRPGGEAPPRSHFLLEAALSRLGVAIVDYLRCLAKAQRFMPRPRPKQSDEDFSRYVFGRLLTDQAAWKTGVEAKLKLSVPPEITSLFCISAADELGLHEPQRCQSVEVQPEAVKVGQRLHIFHPDSGHVVYNAVIATHNQAARLRVRGTDATILYETLARSDWKLGSGWVRRPRARATPNQPPGAAELAPKPGADPKPK
jgi:hypothetical protein